MAKTAPPVAHLSAGVAVLASVVAATLAADGPWEPISVTAGWLVVMLVAMSVVRGRPALIAVAAAIHVARVGVHGIAGDHSPGLAVSAFLLVTMVEFAALSFESRRMPLVVDLAVARALLLAAGAGLFVGVLAPVRGISLVTGAARVVLGVGVAVALATVLLRLARGAVTAAQPERGPERSALRD